jgi:hypothetical protein
MNINLFSVDLSSPTVSMKQVPRERFFAKGILWSHKLESSTHDFPVFMTHNDISILKILGNPTESFFNSVSQMSMTRV